MAFASSQLCSCRLCPDMKNNCMTVRQSELHTSFLIAFLISSLLAVSKARQHPASSSPRPPSMFLVCPAAWEHRLVTASWERVTARLDLSDHPARTHALPVSLVT